MINYKEFLQQKGLIFHPIGFDVSENDINPMLFPFQRDIVRWALKKGRACLFEDCGLGKTAQQLEWAYHISKREKGSVLIVAPLAVAEQTVEEGKKFRVAVNLCESQSDVKKGINITNYEKLHRFEGNAFCGVVLDESSILKNMAGATRNQIIQMFTQTPYRLACSATPSPNDYMELGNHSEFLGVMTYSEMLSMFFVNDSGDVGQWRLKKHANEQEFWKWLCSWAVMLSKPSDLEYKQDGFDLPALKYINHVLPALSNGWGFFITEAETLQERRNVRQETIELRCKKAAELVNNTDDQWVIWCGLNEESRQLSLLIQDGYEISGSTKMERRKELMLGFKDRKYKRLVTKPSIAGFGMNWQNCHKTIFVGLNDSWEQLYQATRRIWRFGQTHPVEAHIVIEEREGNVLRNIQRKDQQAVHMIQQMVNNTKDITKQEIQQKAIKIQEEQLLMKLPLWIQ
jgi:superfamily II DNA or RNA helicase